MFNGEPTMIDLGDTSFENIFLHDFMPMAPGDYVKVYLTAYKYAKEPNKTHSLDHKAIARNLNMRLEQVLEAWSYWEKLGIVKLNDKEDGMEVTFLSLKQLYITEHLMKNKNSQSPAVVELVKANEDKVINEMFNSIDYLMRRPLVPRERQQVLEWVKLYNMTPDVITEAVFIATEKKRVVNLNYVEGIIRRWYDRGMTNMESLVEGLKEEGDAYVRYRKVMNLIGLSHRAISDSDRQVINKWFGEYNFDWPMVELATGEIYKASKPSVAYVEGILNRWYHAGFSTPEDVEENDKKSKPSKKPTRSSPKPKAKGFDNFSGRDDAALEALMREREKWDLEQ